jgi:hypothetical protein
MPAKKKSANSRKMKVRDLKPSKDAKGGGGGSRSRGIKNKNLY